jgi:hypothetical protein
MGRHKQFRPDDVVDCVMDVFWNNGYAATSALNAAIRDGLIRDNPARHVELPSPRRPQAQVRRPMINDTGDTTARPNLRGRPGRWPDQVTLGRGQIALLGPEGVRICR